MTHSTLPQSVDQFVQKYPDYIVVTLNGSKHLISSTISATCRESGRLYMTYPILENAVQKGLAQSLEGAEDVEAPRTCHSIAKTITDTWCMQNCNAPVPNCVSGCVCDGTPTPPTPSPGPTPPSPGPTPGGHGGKCITGEVSILEPWIWTDKSLQYCKYGCSGGNGNNKIPCCCGPDAIKQIPCDLRLPSYCAPPNFSYQNTPSGEGPSTKCSTSAHNCELDSQNNCVYNSSCPRGLPYGTPLNGAWWYLYGCLYGGGSGNEGSVRPGNLFSDYMKEASGGHNSTWYLDNGSIKAYSDCKNTPSNQSCKGPGSFSDFNCPTNKFARPYISPTYPNSPETIDTTNNKEQIYNLGGWGSCAHTTGQKLSFPPPVADPNISYCYYNKRKGKDGKYVGTISVYGETMRCSSFGGGQIPSQKNDFPSKYKAQITSEHLCGMAKTENPCQGANEVWVDQYLETIMSSTATDKVITPENLAKVGYTAISLDIEGVGRDDWTHDDLNALGREHVPNGKLTSTTLKLFLSSYKKQGLKRILTLPGWGVSDYNGGMDWFKDLIPSKPGTSNGDYEHICLMMYSKINDTETQIYVDKGPYATGALAGKPYALLEDGINAIWLNQTTRLHYPLTNADSPYRNKDGHSISSSWYPKKNLEPEHIILGLTFGTNVGLTDLFSDGSKIKGLAKGGITVWAYPLQRPEVINYPPGCAFTSNPGPPIIVPPVGETEEASLEYSEHSGPLSNSFSSSHNIHR